MLTDCGFAHLEEIRELKMKAYEGGKPQRKWEELDGSPTLSLSRQELIRPISLHSPLCEEKDHPRKQAVI